MLGNLLGGPILIGVPEGDTVPCEAQPNPWGLLGGILSTKLASPTGRAAFRAFAIDVGIDFVGALRVA